MAGINTRIVRRTNAITEHSYGYNFRYSESYSFRKGVIGFFKAIYMLIGLGSLRIIIKVRPLLWILKQFFLPKSGQGPSKIKRDNGYFKLKIIGLKIIQLSFKKFINIIHLAIIFLLLKLI